ncbi:hypothetical protein UFOVP822_41 [uncultured Caudovirales phage]|uniref:Uncharacterized protein n=1 Tax=uncultured Caudovirales phage TaxID=2100421 RepID=A0A6J5P2P8_9CAUD|nr:hypothetical protein UFOVP822_41 [uncultured Caudovirales phage]
MIHGYGLKINGTCYGGGRRFLPMGICTAYVTYDAASVSTARENLSQWKNNTTQGEYPQYDRALTGRSYNETYIQTTSFSNYYFDIDDINSWAVRGVNCFGYPPLCMYEFIGPKFKNTLAVIPLSQHKKNPEVLKQGRLTYSFLNADSVVTQSPLLDPLEFSGVYPYAPDDPETVRDPAGWMYSNTNVAEPYLAQTNYEGSGSQIDRSTADSTQLNFLPFVNPLRVFDLEENLIGEFNGLAFILFYGETAFKLPFVDLPEYNGLLPTFSPGVQSISLEANIFLAGEGVLSPRIGRLRWSLKNEGSFNDPALNYFTTYFEKAFSQSYIMPMDLKVRPSQLTEGDPISRDVKIPMSNIKIMVGA